MRTSTKLYSSTAVEKAIDKLYEMGYDLVVLEEGSLLEYGKAVMLAPDDNHYSYLFTEIYLNEWSSAYHVDRRRKLPPEYTPEKLTAAV